MNDTKKQHGLFLVGMTFLRFSISIKKGFVFVCENSVFYQESFFFLKIERNWTPEHKLKSTTQAALRTKFYMFYKLPEGKKMEWVGE